MGTSRKWEPVPRELLRSKGLEAEQVPIWVRLSLAGFLPA